MPSGLSIANDVLCVLVGAHAESSMSYYCMVSEGLCMGRCVCYMALLWSEDISVNFTANHIYKKLCLLLNSSVCEA